MPYNPGIQYRGDQYLYQAVSGLGENIGNAITNYRRSKEESAAADAAFETMVKAAAPMAQQGRLDPAVLEELGNMEKFSGLSLSAKKAKLGQLGVSFKMLLDENARAEEAAARKELETYRNRTLSMQEKGDTRREDLRRSTFRMLMQATPALANPASDASASAAAIARAMEQNPGADPDVAARVIDGIMRRDRESTSLPGAKDVLEVFDVGGQKGVYNRKTGQTMPSMPDSVSAVPVRDAEGNVIGNAMPKRATGAMIPDPRVLSPSTQIRVRDTISELMQQRTLAATMKDTAALKEIDGQIEELKAMLPATKPAAAPAPAAAETSTVIMTNPKGQKVRVPAGRVEEERKRGYK